MKSPERLPNPALLADAFCAAHPSAPPLIQYRRTRTDDLAPRVTCEDGAGLLSHHRLKRCRICFAPFPYGQVRTG
jgi:hypothetical protein